MLLLLLFLLGLVCLIVGLCKSFVPVPPATRSGCALCGWKTDEVQLCLVEQQHTTKALPLCFDCAIEREALSVKALSPLVEA